MTSNAWCSTPYFCINAGFPGTYCEGRVGLSFDEVLVLDLDFFLSDLWRSEREAEPLDFEGPLIIFDESEPSAVLVRLLLCVATGSWYVLGFGGMRLLAV